jgi:5-(carboxyamino)imidazole ribonucleotide synthase
MALKRQSAGSDEALKAALVKLASILDADAFLALKESAQAL